MNDTVKKRVSSLTKELASLPQESLDLIRERLQRDSFSARLDAHHSVRSVLAPGGGSCSKTHLLLLSGKDQTDRSGKTVLPIHQILCGATGEGLPNGVQLVLIRVPQFIATPLSSTPVLATALTRSTQSQTVAGAVVGDRDGNLLSQPVLATVEVEVMTWNPDGTAAANTSFSWMCTIEAARMIYFG